MTKVSRGSASWPLAADWGMVKHARRPQDTGNPAALPAGSQPFPPVHSNARLRIATRIHFALLRHLGDTVEVGDILNREHQTREVLWVCEGSGDAELMSLAQQYRQALVAERAPVLPTAAAVAMPVLRPAPVAAAPAPQDAAWSQDTSGFGVSRPPETVDGPTSAAAPRFRPLRWLLGDRTAR